MMETILNVVLSVDMEAIEQFPEFAVNMLLYAFCLGSLTLEGPRFSGWWDWILSFISSLIFGSSSAEAEAESENQNQNKVEIPTPVVETPVINISSDPQPQGNPDPDTTDSTFESTFDSTFEEVSSEPEPVKVVPVPKVKRSLPGPTIVTNTLLGTTLAAPIPPPQPAPAKFPATPLKIPATPPKVPATPPKIPATPTKFPATPAKFPATPAQVPATPATTKKSVGPSLFTEKKLKKSSTRAGALAALVPRSPPLKAESPKFPDTLQQPTKAREIPEKEGNISRSVSQDQSSEPIPSTSKSLNIKVPPSFRAAVHQAFPYPSSSGYERALRYLESCCSPTVGYQSRISNHRDLTDSVEIKTEIFTSALIYDLIAHLPGISTEIPEILLSLVSKHTGVGVFNKFVDRSVADDVDTTSVCLWALLTPEPAGSPPKIEINSAKAIAKILTLNNNEGGSGRVIQALIPPYPKGTARVEIDVAALANVMRILYFLGMESGAKETEDYIFRWLHNSDNFTQGTAFYHSPDAVLYFLSNSLTVSKKMKTRFSKVMMVRLLSNLGKSDYPLDLALRIMTAYNLGMYTDDEHFALEQSKFQDKAKLDILKMEIMKLRNYQLDDGSWPLDAVYRYDNFYFGSKAAITAFSTKALYVSRNISNI